MSVLTPNRAAASRRHMVFLSNFSGTAPVSLAGCPNLPLEHVQLRIMGKWPLGVIALAVLVAHGLAVFGLRHTFESNLKIAQPHALAIEWAPLPPAAGPTTPQAITPLAPLGADHAAAHASRSPARSPAIQRHAVRETHVNPDSPAHAPAIAPRNEQDAATHSETSQRQVAAPAIAATNDESSRQSAASSGNKESTPLPVTEPSFGAAYLHNPAPDYPAVAQQRHWQGTVQLKVHVLMDGKPDEVSVASSSGHTSLDDAAVEAVKAWRFTPAKRGEQAIDGWVRVPIEFKLGT